MDRPYLTLKQMAEVLKISENELLELVEKKQIPFEVTDEGTVYQAYRFIEKDVLTAFKPKEISEVPFLEEEPDKEPEAEEKTEVVKEPEPEKITEEEDTPEIKEPAEEQEKPEEAPEEQAPAEQPTEDQAEGPAEKEPEPAEDKGKDPI